MVIDVLLTLGSWINNLIAWILSAGTTLIPNNITDAMEWFFSKAMTFNGIFPIVTFGTALITVISVYLAKYTIKIMLWLVSFIPFIKYHELPHMSETRSTSTHVDKFGNVSSTSRRSITKKKGYFRR